jgi:phosphomannomutase
MKPLMMSLSGVRGVIGETLTPQLALNIGCAYGQVYGKGPIIVGGDTRTSHHMVSNALISGLTSVGTDVILIGKVPTPTVQQMIRHFNAKAGLVVTASHNPIIWNGIKMMNGSGAFFEQDEFDAFNTVFKNESWTLQAWDNIGKITPIDNALDHHTDLVLDHVDVNAIRKAGLKVCVDPNNGAGCDADIILLDKLGVKYDIINGEGNGLFSHSPEPVKDNLTDLMSAMKNGNYDIGFAQDADADRLVIIDENGTFIGEDYSLAICIEHILRNSNDTPKKVVVNLSTSLVIEQLCNKYNAQIFYTKIGESNVTQTLKSEKATVGGEGNGGVIYPKIGWGRDSLAGIAIALDHLAKEKKRVSEIVSAYPKYTMVREKRQLENKDDVAPLLEKIDHAFSENDKNREDGLKVLMDNGWIHVRPSNTEPIIRIFIEAESAEIAESWLTKVKNL